MAHGFCKLEDKIEIIYKYDIYYQKVYDSGIIWDGNNFKIEWSMDKPIIFPKDLELMTFNKFFKI